MDLWLFVFGAVFGSFINVLTLRYTGEEFLFSNKILSGRSHCRKCDRTLGWFELIPILSFVLLRGRCRTCHTKISFQYPIVEVVAGLIFVLGLMVVAGADLMKTVKLTGVLIIIGLIVFELRCWGRSMCEVACILVRHYRRPRQLRLDPLMVAVPVEISAVSAVRRPRWKADM